MDVAKNKASWAQVKAAMYGRWLEGIAALVPGITSRQLEGKPSPCPICGGTDRFRLDNKGDNSSYICGQCGAGDGFNLIAKSRGITDAEAKDLVGDWLGLNGMEATPANQEKSLKPPHQDGKPQRTPEEIKDTAQAIINNCERGLPVYLKNKGYTGDYLVNRSHFQLPNSKQFVPAGAFVIPIQNINDLTETISVQYIPEDGKIKYHLKDFKKINGVITIPGDDASPHIAIGTGKATCLAFSLAMGCPTFSLFDDTNLVNNCTKIADLFPGKRVLIIGDNDTHKGHTGGQDAANEAETKTTNGLAIISPYKDFDDYRQDHGIEATKAEIERQIAEFAHVGGKGQANVTAPNGFYNQAIVNECIALKTRKQRVKWTIKHNTPQQNHHLYALVLRLKNSFGSGLTIESFERLLEHKVKIPMAIKDFIDDLIESKTKQAAELYKLDEKPFKQNYKYLELVNNRLNWEPIAEEITKSSQKVFAIHALQGSGKTEDLAKQLVNSFRNDGVFYLTHRQKLVAQAAKTLNLLHYMNDKQIIKEFGHVQQLACCTPSLKNETYLNSIKKAKLVIVDEFIQWFDDLLTNDTCINPKLKLQERLQAAMKEAMLNGCKFVLLDADLTTKGIDQFKRFLDIKLDDILLITAEAPKRKLTVDISVSAAAAHYRTYGIRLMEKDLDNKVPFLVAMESVASAKAMFYKILSWNKNAYIVLLIGGQCLVSENGITRLLKTKEFIGDDINKKLPGVEALIYTCIIGTGVSITDKKNSRSDDYESISFGGTTDLPSTSQLQRFTRCYGFFIGAVLSPMDTIQTIKRGRDVTEYVVCILDRQYDYMSSPGKDIGAEAWSKQATENNIIDTLTAEINHNKLRNKELFIPGIVSLLRDKHRMTIIGQLSIEEKVDGLIPDSEIKEDEQAALMAAIPHPNLKEAQARKMAEYCSDEERYACEARRCLDCFNIKESRVPEAAAKIWSNPSKRAACRRMELIIKLLRGDTDLTIKNAEARRQVLTASGITLDLLLNPQRLTNDDINHLRDIIEPNCSLLVGSGFIPERYVKKIPTKSTIKPIQTILAYIGLDTKTIRTGKTGAEYELEISVPSPMVSRLKLEIRLSKEEEKQVQKQAEINEAHRLRSLIDAEGKSLSLSKIGEAMNKTKRQVQELLKN